LAAEEPDRTGLPRCHLFAERQAEARFQMITVDDLLEHLRQPKKSPLHPFWLLSESEVRKRIEEISIGAKRMRREYQDPRDTAHIKRLSSTAQAFRAELSELRPGDPLIDWIPPNPSPLLQGIDTFQRLLAPILEAARRPGRRVMVGEVNRILVFECAVLWAECKLETVSTTPAAPFHLFVEDLLAYSSEAGEATTATGNSRELMAHPLRAALGTRLDDACFSDLLNRVIRAFQDDLKSPPEGHAWEGEADPRKGPFLAQLESLRVFRGGLHP
jgi:hypothetical protein